jgi:hypothetical protein
MTAHPLPVTGQRQELRVTAATLVAVVSVVVAAALRLPALNWMPLDLGEAGVALGALTGAGSRSIGSPLLVQLDRLSFWLWGAGDAVARVVPALAGVAMVGLAPRLWGWIGRPAALVAAILFAASPAWVFFSRHASAGTLAGAAVLLLLASLAGNAAGRRVLVPIAFAVVVAAGGAAYTALLAFALAAVLPFAGHGRVLEWLEELWPDSQARRQAALTFAVALLVVATGILTQPQGFASLVEAPAVWAGRLGAVGRGAGTGVLLPLLANAPLETLGGLAGLIVLLRSRSPLAGALWVWTSVALGVALLTGLPGSVPDVLLPLTLAAGVAGATLWERLIQHFKWTDEGLMVGVLAMVLGFSALQWMTLADVGVVMAGTAAPDTATAWLARGSLVMAFVLLAAYFTLWGADVAARVGGTTWLIVLAALGWANGARLNYLAADELREPLRPDYMTPDLRRLADILADRGRQQTRVMVAPQLEAMLAWPLREFGDVTWDEPAGEIDADAVIRPAGETVAFGPASYMGSTFRVRGIWQPNLTGPQALARWLLQRRPAPGQETLPDIVYDPVDLYLIVE